MVRPRLPSSWLSRRVLFDVFQILALWAVGTAVSWERLNVKLNYRSEDLPQQALVSVLKLSVVHWQRRSRCFPKYSVSWSSSAFLVHCHQDVVFKRVYGCAAGFVSVGGDFCFGTGFVTGGATFPFEAAVPIATAGGTYFVNCRFCD